MNTIRIAVVSALTLICAQAFAQDATMTPQGSGSADQSAAATAVGGVPSSTSQMSAPMGKTRQQVYQDLVQSEQSGQLARLQQGIYKGN
jgi:hypothetical protein